MNEANIDRFLEFAKHRREKQHVTVVTTNQLAQMLSVIHAENMETMWYGMVQCGIKEKDFRLREDYYRKEIEKIFN
jgi:hypothetical protein